MLLTNGIFSYSSLHRRSYISREMWKLGKLTRRSASSRASVAVISEAGNLSSLLLAPSDLPNFCCVSPPPPPQQIIGKMSSAVGGAAEAAVPPAPVMMKLNTAFHLTPVSLCARAAAEEDVICKPAPPSEEPRNFGMITPLFTHIP